jgi:acetoin utilization deacetylase AcuC-like enzyme
MISAVPVFYSDEVIADAKSFSQGPLKPKAALKAWRKARIPLELLPIVPATVEELAAVHDRQYVENVLSGRIDNGFGNSREDVARSLPFTNGAMLCAARHAMTCGVACAPVGGFHHACYDLGRAFCSFNGLMVAAVQLLSEGVVQRIMILDVDMHYGDGTDSILSRLGLAALVENVTFGLWFTAPAHAGQYLQRLEKEVSRFHEFDLVICQLGVDVHVDDPLGGVLTTEQIRLRDEVVFRAARESGVPIAWNLAGGYQRPLSKVIDLHTQTMIECAKAYVGTKVTL